MKRENTLTHGSLFSGIGGFELGAEKLGIEITHIIPKEE